jgi:hypothetical protein
MLLSSSVYHPFALNDYLSDRFVLSAVNSNENGTYSSHTIDEKGSLKLVANTFTHGRRPTFALFLNETAKEKRAFVLNVGFNGLERHTVYNINPDRPRR